jgi:hypothetical protein
MHLGKIKQGDDGDMDQTLNNFVKLFITKNEITIMNSKTKKFLEVQNAILFWGVLQTHTSSNIGFNVANWSFIIWISWEID